jgi:hypothetical protein
MSAKPKSLVLERVCLAVKYADLQPPVAVGEDDGQEVLCLDEQALRVVMTAQSLARRKSHALLVDGVGRGQQQFDSKVYGFAEFVVVLHAPADLKLWLCVKSSDSDSVFVSVNGSDFVSWHINATHQYAWRKFWKNVPLPAGTHTLQISTKYQQLYISHLWLGTGSFNPAEAPAPASLASIALPLPALDGRSVPDDVAGVGRADSRLGGREGGSRGSGAGRVGGGEAAAADGEGEGEGRVGGGGDDRDESDGDASDGSSDAPNRLGWGRDSHSVKKKVKDPNWDYGAAAYAKWESEQEAIDARRRREGFGVAELPREAMSNQSFNKDSRPTTPSLAANVMVSAADLGAA